MSLRSLNGFAYGIAYKFSASAEFFVGMAVAHSVSRVEADLLAMSVHPDEFAIERNLNLLRMCRDNLLELMRRFPAVHLARAQLVLGLDPTTAEHRPNGSLLVPAQITVLIEGDNGSTWSGTVKTQALGVQ
jgi:hypothetical protein